MIFVKFERVFMVVTIGFSLRLVQLGFPLLHWNFLLATVIFKTFVVHELDAK